MPETYAIVDATDRVEGAQFPGMAARYVQWELAREGIAAPLISPREPLADPPDVLLVTAVSAGNWECVRATLRTLLGHHLSAKRGPRPAVVLGGQAAMAPAVFDPMIDVACVGEGRTFLRTLARGGLTAAKELPNAWVPGETREVTPDTDFPWDAPPVRVKGGAVALFASRGCHKKCLFCQVGWQQPYVEQDEDRLLRQAAALRAAGYRVKLVTNDAPAVAAFAEIGSRHMSASYSQLRAMIEQGGIEALKGKVQQVRLGVESPSARLRRWIGKPIDTGALYDLTVRLLNLGISVRWYMIAGLPGETDADYDELLEVGRRIRHDARKCALQLDFTAFCPDPAAPLCLAPLVDDYQARFEAYRREFFRTLTHRLQLFAGRKPPARLAEARGSMGATEEELRRGWLDRDPPNWRVAYPLRSQCRTAYNVYAKRVGLPLSEL